MSDGDDGVTLVYKSQSFVQTQSLDKGGRFVLYLKMFCSGNCRGQCSVSDIPSLLLPGIGYRG